MHKKGHYGATLLGYAPLGAVTLAVGFEAAAVVGGAVAVALAMVPDLDMKIPGVAHRGVTHTVRFALAIGAVIGTVGAALMAVGGAPIAVAVGAGVFGFVTGAVAIGSHIAADALTPMGVEPFGDDGPHYSLDLVRAANPIANYALLVAGAVAVGLAWIVGSAVASVGV